MMPLALLPVASFPKALAAASVLSAFLVACGGGNETQTIKVISEEPQPDPQQEAIKESFLELQNAQSNLSLTDPTAESIQDLQDAIDALNTLLLTFPSSDKKEWYRLQIYNAQNTVIYATERIGKEKVVKLKNEVEDLEEQVENLKDELSNVEQETIVTENTDTVYVSEGNPVPSKKVRELAKATYGAFTALDASLANYSSDKIKINNSVDLISDTNLSSLSGWKGKKYIHSGTSEIHEAYVYSHVESLSDTEYPSYGYWMKKNTFGKPLSINVFLRYKSPTGYQPNLTTTNATGSAKYVGSAVGQFAIFTNDKTVADSGQFTATATLNATFGTGDQKISGTIDNFNGPSNGSSWVVELKESEISKDSGTIRTANTNWTINGESVTPDTPDISSWYGFLHDIDTDTKPKVIYGAFYSLYRNPDAKIIGGFGAKKE